MTDTRLTADQARERLESEIISYAMAIERRAKAENELACARSEEGRFFARVREAISILQEAQGTRLVEVRG